MSPLNVCNLNTPICEKKLDEAGISVGLKLLQYLYFCVKERDV